MAKGKVVRKNKKKKQDNDKMVKLLRLWQDIEKQSIESTSEIMAKTKNPLVRQIMEIIRNDSTQHHRVQQFIIDSLTKSPARLSSRELDEVWDEIEKHDEVEKAAIDLAKQLRKECHSVVERTLLDYLFIDEEKHDLLIEQLEKISKQM